MSPRMNSFPSWFVTDSEKKFDLNPPKPETTRPWEMPRRAVRYRRMRGRLMTEPAAHDAADSVEGLHSVEALFDRAVGLAPLERAAFLEAACGGDPTLRAEVQGLLACDEGLGSGTNLLDSPLLQRPTNGG